MAYHAKAWILGLAALAFFGPAAAVEGPLTGVWRGPYGVFVLDQQGATVRGSTFYNEATLQGTLDGETLRFHWRDALGQEGDASLRLDPDQAELQVEWPLGGEAGLPVSWRAIRYVEPAAPPGQRSRWRVVMDLRDFPEAAGQVTGSADLFFAGDRVAGWLSGHFVPVAPDTGASLAEGVEGIMVSYRIEGQQAGDTLRLSLLNPHDDSMTEAVVARRPEGLVGTWRDQSPSSGPLAAPPQQGTIHLTPEEGPPTPTPTEEAKARHRRLWQVAQHVGEAWASPLGGDPRRAIQAMIQRGAFKDAVQAADQMAQAAAAAGLPTLQADAMLLRANALSADGFFAEARDAYTRLQTHPGATAFHQDMAEAGLLSLSLHIGSVQPLAVPPLPALAVAEDDPLSLKDRGFRAEKEGRDEEALAFYDRAAVLYRAAWESQTTPVLRESQGTSLAIALQHGVTLETRRRQWDAAARRLEETLSVWRSVAGGAGPTASLLGTRAMVQRAQGHLPEAWASITEALATAEAAHVAETWPLHGMAGRLARARGDATGAEAAFRQAITNVETLRGRLTTDETKIAFFGTPADLYEEFVAFLMDTQQPEAALEIAEKARARALLDGVGGAGGEGEGFAGETPSPASAPTVSAADALALARARDTAFLVYFLTRAKLYVWLLTPQGRVYSGAQAADPASVAQAVQALREPLVFGESFEAPRRALNDLLTGPVAAALDALPPASRLSIVPHKILAQVPFAMLGPTPGAWAEAWSLTVLPSLSVGAQRSARPLPPDGPLLAVGYSTAHRPLPAVAGELKAAAALYPGATILSEADATASRLRAELPHYPLILIAAHSARRPGAPGDVGQGEPLEIVLSGSALTSRDLKPGLTPRAGLVILSACETLQGVQVAGDELLNLARAFLIAGAERVLLTQWEVEDAATATLVPALLAGVREGQSPAWALHNAVQAYRLAHANDGPAAWAAWILVGPHD